MSKIYKTFLTIFAAHLIIDFMLGIFPIYKTVANIDTSMAGVIMGFGLIVGESAQLLIGHFSDRGLQKLLMISGVLLGSGLSLLSFTQHPLLLFFVVLSCYLGSAAFHPSASSLTGGLCDKRQGFFLSLFSVGGMIGAAVSQFLFVQLMILFNGNTLILLVPPFIMSLAIFQHIPVSQKIRGKTRSLQKQLNYLWNRKSEIVPLYGMQVTGQIIIASIMFLLPDFFLEKGMMKGFCFGGAHLCLLLGGALFNLAIAKYNDHWNRKVMVAILMLTGMAFLYALIAVKMTLILGIILTAGLGASLTTLQPVIVAEGNSTTSKDSRGVINGLLLGGASSPAGFGVMIAAKICDTYSPSFAMQAVAGLSVVFFMFNFFSIPSCRQELCIEK